MQPTGETSKRSRKDYLGIGYSKKDSPHPRIEKRKKEEASEERMDHLLELTLREKQRGWCAKAFFSACSECDEVLRSFPQPGRAIVVDTIPPTDYRGSILKNCSHCLVRNVSWIISIARLSKEEKEKHFNRISTPLTQYGADLLVKSMEGYEKNRFIVVVIPY